MKKIIAVMLAAIIAMCACAFAEGSYKVGICNYVDDASLNQIVENIQSRLDAIAAETGKSFEVDYQNCNADASVMQQIISNFIADGADAVFTPTDNTIMTAELSIYEMLAEAGIPHYTGADSFALNGAFLGYGVDYANLGVETANMVAQILVDGASPAETPVMTFDNGTATINTETCEAVGLDFDAVSEAFAPFCTSIKSIQTAESFD